MAITDTDSHACDEAMSVGISRRHWLAASGSLFAWSFMPRFAHAAQARDPRFVTIILRGAMDGLSAVAPVGDPDYVALRDSIALSTSGDKPAIPLDGFFALHPAMPNFARLYKAGQAMVVHAVATPYRDRSHFDGQDCLESGYEKIVANIESGWLNRALQVLPKGERVAPPSGLGIGTMAPLILRGQAPVLGWAPPSLPKASDDFAKRVLDLYAHRDRGLFEALNEGMKIETIAAKSGMDDSVKARGGEVEQMKIAATGAARLLANDEGPRIAALSFNGWDTHANEGGATGRLAQLLSGLDAALAAFEQGLKPVWKDTTILVVTEFGRTAKINGTVGTDHGTATVAFLVGGAVKGGRVLADWPGLKPANLYENRDLAPTTDLRAVVKGILAEQWDVSEALLAERVFPGSTLLRPMAGLTA
jgi:uncharacterized protein (DUF1501 family)